MSILNNINTSICLKKLIYNYDNSSMIDSIFIFKNQQTVKAICSFKNRKTQISLKYNPYFYSHKNKFNSLVLVKRNLNNKIV